MMRFIAAVVFILFAHTSPVAEADIHRAELAKVVELRNDLKANVKLIIDDAKWGAFARSWQGRWDASRPTKAISIAGDMKAIALDVSTSHGYLQNWFSAVAFKKSTDADKWERETQVAIDSAMRRIVAHEMKSPRKFTDASGKFMVTATFVRIDGDSVVLAKQGGATISVSLAKLSKSDREWIAIATKAPPSPPRD